ncbi:hypothetical protein HUJ04_007879 [Dendroctonus ponderosae]
MKVGKRFAAEILLGVKLEVAAFTFCKACCKNNENMSIQQGAFAAKKVRSNMEKRERQYSNDGKLEASHYNSKYMNSIWGMYNRFSVHNLKKVMDRNIQSQSNVGQAVKGLAASTNLSVSAERLSYQRM